MSEFWEIEEENVDSARFFRTLPKYFPEATIFYAEGTTISDGVRKCYETHREEGKYLPPRQTFLPVLKKFRCKFSTSFMNQLAGLAQQHAERELLDHMLLYKGAEEVVFWHDAFANVLLVSRSVPENVVSQFAGELGLEFHSGQSG